MGKGSIWREKENGVSFPELQSSMEVDVLIVGGGITGLTTALLLTEAGKKVALLEAQQIGSGTTGFSSCHLTTDIDEEYRNIIKHFGREKAALVAESRKAAIDFIEKTSREKNIACDFRRLPGYLYTEIPEDVEALREEAEAATQAGLKVQLTDTVPLPFKIKKALKFEGQAEFNSQQYLEGLAQHTAALGALIFENTRVIEMSEEEGFYYVKGPSGYVKAKQVVMATHLPLFFNVLQTVSAPYISYMMAAKLKTSEHPVGLFWDTAEPYHYIRYYKKDDNYYLVVGGEDHKTGHESNTDERYAQLENYIRGKFNIESIAYKWSAQYYEPADGLPYIGRSPFSSNAFVATGFSGDGLIYGTIAGILISDMIFEKDNSWLTAYDSSRFTPAASMVDFIKENADSAKNFIKDRISAEKDDLATIAPGEGKIVSVDGEKMAVSRDENYDLHAVSPACTHMKCFVHWNKSEKTWDCPCHGSRFDSHGEVLYGPAVRALAKKEIKSEIAQANFKKE